MGMFSELRMLKRGQVGSGTRDLLSVGGMLCYWDACPLHNLVQSVDWCSTVMTTVHEIMNKAQDLQPQILIFWRIYSILIFWGIYSKCCEMRVLWITRLKVVMIWHMTRIAYAMANTVQIWNYWYPKIISTNNLIFHNLNI